MWVFNVFVHWNRTLLQFGITEPTSAWLRELCVSKGKESTVPWCQPFSGCKAVRPFDLIVVTVS